MEQNKFEELTSFKEELERYEKQGFFNDLQFKMECIVNFDHNTNESWIEYSKLIQDFKVYILKIRQAEINELKAEITTLKRTIDEDEQDTIDMLEGLKDSINKCHAEYASECVDDLIDYLKGNY